MSTPVTENDSLKAEPADSDVDVTTHLEDARKFFAEEPAAPAEPAKAVTPTAQPAAKEPNKPMASPLASVVASPVTTAAAVTTEPVKTATPDDLTKDIDAIKDPAENTRSAPDWKSLKAVAKEARLKAHENEQKFLAAQKELEVARKAAASPEADAATKARIAELEAQNKQFSDRLKVLNLESHPDFEKQFVAPQTQAKAALAEILNTEEVKGVDLDSLLALKGRKFNEAASEILEKLTPLSQSKFVKNLDVLVEARHGAEQALANADKFIDTRLTEAAARSRQAFDQVGKKYSGYFVSQTADEKAAPEEQQAVAAYNTGLASIGKRAENNAFGKGDEVFFAENAHKAAMLDFLMEHGLPRIASVYGRENSAKDARIAELEGKLASLSAAKPVPSGGAGVGAPNSGGSEEEDHLSAARRAFAQG